MKLWCNSSGTTSHGSKPDINGINLQSTSTIKLLIAIPTSPHTTKEITLGTMPNITNRMRLSSLITPRLLMLIILRTPLPLLNIISEKEELELPLLMRHHEKYQKVIEFI